MVIMENPKQKTLKKAKQPKMPDVDSDEELEEMAASENVPKEVLVIAQEVKIVKSLACNDLKKRSKQMRKLRKWLELRSKSSFTFGDEDFMRIWKGLYYNMWMSDKPLVQEDLAEQLAQLLQCFDDLELSVRFFSAFVRTMCQEWFGIDQWRIDKFLMLTRRMLRYMFRVLKTGNWPKEAILLFNEHMLNTVLAEKIVAAGLTMHYMDIFFEELAKVSDGELSAEQMGDFVRPFVAFMATQKDGKLTLHCRSRVFYHLLYQSALGREYSEKYNAWKDMGFPTASIHDLEKEETESQTGDDDDAEPHENNAETIQRHLDPRAGNVDVFMPELQLDGKYIIEELEMFIYKRDSSTKKRKMLKKLLHTFQKYRQGEFPLGVKSMPRFELKSDRPLIKDKVEKLENMENEMFGLGRKLKQMNKRKRRKFLKSLNFEEVNESNYEQMIEKALPKQYFQRKQQAKNAMMNGWLEEELDEAPSTAENETSSNEASSNQQQSKTKKQKTDKLPLIQIAGQRPKPKKNAAAESIKEEVPAKKFKKVEADFKKMELKTTVAVEQVTLKEKPIAHQPNSKVEQSTEKQAIKLTNSIAKKNKQQLSTSLSSEWDNAPAEGEIEYFIPSRKLQLKKANSDLVLNPLAARKAAAEVNQSTPKNKTAVSAAHESPKTPGSIKRVKIALKHNTAQAPSEYIKQLKSSPNVPYDASKKPGKGLLKPNSMPSPINPFYKKKIGLRLLNDTL